MSPPGTLRDPFCPGDPLRTDRCRAKEKLRPRRHRVDPVRCASGKWIGAVRFGPQAGLRQVPRPPRRAAGPLKDRNGVEDPRRGLTRRPTGWFASADLPSDRDTLSPTDIHAAVRMLTAARADDALAAAGVDVAQSAAADYGRELAARADDLDNLRRSTLGPNRDERGRRRR